MSNPDGISAYNLTMAHAMSGLVQLEIEDLTSYLDNEGPFAKRYRQGQATRGELVVEIAGRLAEAALKREPVAG